MQPSKPIFGILQSSSTMKRPSKVRPSVPPTRISPGVDLRSFFNTLYDVEQEANGRSATIKKLQETDSVRVRNHMASFFALLKNKLGLREKPLPHGPKSS